jgi:hypothetical protein
MYDTPAILFPVFSFALCQERDNKKRRERKTFGVCSVLVISNLFQGRSKTFLLVDLFSNISTTVT